MIHGRASTISIRCRLRRNDTLHAHSRCLCFQCLHLCLFLLAIFRITFSVVSQARRTDNEDGFVPRDRELLVSRRVNRNVCCMHCAFQASGSIFLFRKLGHAKGITWSRAAPRKSVFLKGISLEGESSYRRNGAGTNADKRTMWADN